MANETYTMLDAMREEIDSLKELESIYKRDKNNLRSDVIASQRRSLQRIVNRFEKGYEYFWGINKEGAPELQYRIVTRQHDREYPDLAKENPD